MKLYNTPKKALEEFVPINPDNVRVYTCGPTVYSYQHIGNYTAYIYWDTLVRTLTLNGYKVNRVLNLTDVGHLSSDADEGEDKMEKGAKALGKTVWDVAEFYGDNYLENFRKLGMIEPTKVAKATDYIEQDLELIRKLKKKGYTYQIDDGIYYDTSKFPIYADFAHLDVESLKAGARVEHNKQKRSITDFALWKFVRPGEKHDMQWGTPKDLLDDDSDSVVGYPGWHIECSAIIGAELGETIDIHTGGIDHIPVHHTNEVAQSVAANGKPLANYWLHNNFITIEGKKISKSLGNVYNFADLAERGFSHMDYRMWTLQGHYQTERVFSFDNLAAAKNRLLKWRNFAALRHQFNETLESSETEKRGFWALPKALLEVVSDNLNTPKALSMIDEGFLILENTNLDDIDLGSLKKFINFLDELLGLGIEKSTQDISDDMKKLILERSRAREGKDWAESDRLREEIESMGDIVLRDTPSRTIWEYKS